MPTLLSSSFSPFLLYLGQPETVISGKGVNRFGLVRVQINWLTDSRIDWSIMMTDSQVGEWTHFDNFPTTPQQCPFTGITGIAQNIPSQFLWLECTNMLDSLTFPTFVYIELTLIRGEREKMKRNSHILGLTGTNQEFCLENPQVHSFCWVCSAPINDQSPWWTN